MSIISDNNMYARNAFYTTIGLDPFLVEMDKEEEKEQIEEQRQIEEVYKLQYIKTKTAVAACSGFGGGFFGIGMSFTAFFPASAPVIIGFTALGVLVGSLIGSTSHEALCTHLDLMDAKEELPLDNRRYARLLGKIDEIDSKLTSGAKNVSELIKAKRFFNSTVTTFDRRVIHKMK